MISVIIPTYQSPDLLTRAIDSLLNQTSPDWQAIVCPDDGLDYNWLAKKDSRITVVDSTWVKTGPSSARNRGLPYVQGWAIAYLDDDDWVSSKYIELSVNVLKTQPAVVFPTVYVDTNGSTIRAIGTDLSYLDISNFSQCLGSLHVVVLCEYFTSWQNCFAEDVVHTCEIIDRVGGKINIAQEAQYIATVNPVSICSTNTDIDCAYKVLINSKFNMSVEAIADTKNLFEYRKKINLLYESMSATTDYHTFISSYLTSY